MQRKQVCLSASASDTELLSLFYCGDLLLQLLCDNFLGFFELVIVLVFLVAFTIEFYFDVRFNTNLMDIISIRCKVFANSEFYSRTV